MFIQILANSIISSFIIALVALGFNLIFSTTKVFHLAHGAIYTFSVYSFWAVCNLVLDGNTESIQNIIIAFGISVLLIFFIVLIIEKSVYEPISKRTSNQTITLIASMGVYLLMVNFLATLFSNETKTLSTKIRETINIIGIALTPIQISQGALGAFIILTIALLFKYSNFGLQIKAVNNSTKVSSGFGINVSKVRIISLFLGSILAAIAAILKGYETGFDPNIGFSITLTAAVVVVLSGPMSITGTIIASFIISLVQNFAEYVLSAEWKEPITFVILLVVLLWKTEGIIHYNIRLEEK